jgi:hypothetical protein
MVRFRKSDSVRRGSPDPGDSPDARAPEDLPLEVKQRVESNSHMDPRNLSSGLRSIKLTNPKIPPASLTLTIYRVLFQEGQFKYFHP